MGTGETTLIFALRAIVGETRAIRPKNARDAKLNAGDPTGMCCKTARLDSFRSRVLD
jgi:TnpA family transposase